jgi:Ca-activated chloride channel family protein
VIYALSDMFRHLRENDEAFIVAYGRNVGIEQDLTWNYELLEKAMDRIDRKPGAALLEAVAFSSGHLARVARNPNRVLLVISDGTNEVGKVNPLEHAAEIRASGARIYCIGIGVPGSAERNRLQEIASRTGGGATFVEDPRAFRNAAHAIAESVGIDFPQ